MGEINVKLHIIDKEINLYLSHIYYNPLYKLEMKDKWLRYDGHKWYYITKIQYIKNEELVNEITFEF